MDNPFDQPVNRVLLCAALILVLGDVYSALDGDKWQDPMVWKAIGINAIKYGVLLCIGLVNWLKDQAQKKIDEWKEAKALKIEIEKQALAMQFTMARDLMLCSGNEVLIKAAKEMSIQIIREGVDTYVIAQERELRRRQEEIARTIPAAEVIRKLQADLNQQKEVNKPCQPIPNPNP